MTESAGLLPTWAWAGCQATLGDPRAYLQGTCQPQLCHMSAFAPSADMNMPKYACIAQVHEIDGRVAAVEALLRGAGFSYVLVSQGLAPHTAMVYACREGKALNLTGD